MTAARTSSSGADRGALAESEGIRVLYAEVAWMYQQLGRAADARRLVETYDAGNLPGLPRDQDYLLTLQLTLDVALAQGLSRRWRPSRRCCCRTRAGRSSTPGR